jgi:hypothetical protein
MSKTYYKVLPHNMTLHRFKYQEGLNIKEFNSIGSCQSGGLYYTTFEHLISFHFRDSHIREVTIPNDAQTYESFDKWRSNKIILGPKLQLKDLPEWSDYVQCRHAVRQNGYALEFVKDDEMSQELCQLAVRQNGFALKFVKDDEMSQELCQLAVRQNGFALKFVKDDFMTRQLCYMAIQQNGFALKFVKDDFMTRQLCYMAIQQNECALRVVKDEFKDADLYDFIAKLRMKKSICERSLKAL